MAREMSGAAFADATLGFLRETVPRNWADLCDSVTDNFRVINPKDFRVMTRTGYSMVQACQISEYIFA